MFSKQLLRHLFYYSGGQLIHTSNRGRWKNQGKPAGYLTNNGYLSVSICGRRFMAHRLVWTWHYGDIPEGKQIDHINGDRVDNRIENLRLATCSQNQRNRDMNSLYKNVHRGVSPTKYNTWKARISVDGRERYLGSFKTHKEAVAARLSEEVRLGVNDLYR